jgi:hypothetical protein
MDAMDFSFLGRYNWKQITGSGWSRQDVGSNDGALDGLRLTVEEACD